MLASGRANSPAKLNASSERVAVNDAKPLANSVALVTGASNNLKREINMTSNVIRNPHGGYRNRSVEIPPGSRVLYISGQTATDENGVTPPDAESQADIVYARIVESLHEAGMDVTDVVKTNLYMVNPADIGAIAKAGQKHFKGHT